MVEKLAIILVNFNNNDDTIQCVESIKRSEKVQPYVIIVDNCSDDPTTLQQLSQVNNNVHLILNEKNLGFGRANNIGIEWATSHLSVNYLLLLNNDTIVESDALYAMVARLAKTDCSIVVPKIFYADTPDTIWYAGGEIDWRLGRARSYGLNEKDNGYDQGRFITFASGCAMLARKDIFGHVGSFDERMFMYVEDVDLSMRLGRLGHKIYFEPQAIVYHKVQGGQRNRDTQYVSGWSPQNPNLSFHLYHGVKNSIIAMRNNANILIFSRYAFLYSMFLLYKYLFFCKNGRKDTLPIMLKAIKDSFKK